MKPLAHVLKWLQLYGAAVGPTASNNKTDRICHLSNSRLQITCSLGWPLTFYISKEDIKLLILRPPFTTNHVTIGIDHHTQIMRGWRMNTGSMCLCTLGNTLLTEVHLQPPENVISKEKVPSSIIDYPGKTTTFPAVLTDMVRPL